MVGHYNCGGIKAALASAKLRDRSGKLLPKNPNTCEAINTWLKPIRSLAVAQLRSGNGGSDDPDEEQRRLCRTHCVAQAANIESSETVMRAQQAGQVITVDAWVYDIAQGKLIE